MKLIFDSAAFQTRRPLDEAQESQGIAFLVMKYGTPKWAGLLVKLPLNEVDLEEVQNELAELLDSATGMVYVKKSKSHRSREKVA